MSDLLGNAFDRPVGETGAVVSSADECGTWSAPEVDRFLGSPHA